MIINGQELIITPASLDDAMDLQDTVLKAIYASKIKFDFLKDEDNNNLLDMIDDKDDDVLNKMEIPTDLISDFFNTIVTMGMSKTLRKQLFICAERAVFGKDRNPITKEFFEDVDNRQYYFQIMIEVLKVNLTPFFRGLFSQYSEIIGKMKTFLKQK